MIIFVLQGGDCNEWFWLDWLYVTLSLTVFNLATVLTWLLTPSVPRTGFNCHWWALTVTRMLLWNKWSSFSCYYGGKLGVVMPFELRTRIRCSHFSWGYRSTMPIGYNQSQWMKIGGRSLLPTWLMGFLVHGENQLSR